MYEEGCLYVAAAGPSDDRQLLDRWSCAVCVSEYRSGIIALATVRRQENLVESPAACA